MTEINAEPMLFLRRVESPASYTNYPQPLLRPSVLHRLMNVELR